jgi:hypothetical protein
MPRDERLVTRFAASKNVAAAFAAVVDRGEEREFMIMTTPLLL